MQNLILSIESSCDDSSIALIGIDAYTLIFHQKISQEAEHSTFGGVVPELASRLHAESLPLILEKTKPYLSNLKAIAVTNEPGLNVTLLEGVMMAKTLSYALNLPLIGVNHLKGHLYSLFLNSDAIFPLGVLLVSGGHTMLLEAESFEKINIKAQSLDDSFGESFDKVAKMLSLGYPGGPIVESCAKKGVTKFKLPIPLRSKKQFAFSFSGLKNAVRLEIEAKSSEGALEEGFKADLCASFQESAIAHLMQKCKIFFEENAKKSRSWKYFGVVGGASANLVLREKIQAMCNFYGVELLLAPLEFCSDNAAMIGRAAVESYRRKEFSKIDSLQTRPRIDVF
ncbi:tRNA (adenosine(37)-N6)-threonylcarbamoyltransferase complex transferase subunit TsaD [Helicobacter sp.]|uniref:tRNA (adenosine(37)-N6)-threonylcarbamoyltransferase complex transferase subunit TsaD n=1 Tax=Helicobacter sp. TaxID=218 RepID=UPI0025BF8237|nr:tRNA (adenosine(37)-N6)-threonylcarbamoyltransferase complex transferase subunit TsaD [Helicobacter sp.]MCI5968989.1 tRNA (adenosine(37)-N6)-threonylcarbamoyltransferase complex transferase subunit TsaD [Helicobacter sp.]MDY2584135.1 tRNA (adenosine(37)-N6)-threonylcarbamoyltransferase complex transferase subunit TsaD [Helicobacter sp.]